MLQALYSTLDQYRDPRMNWDLISKPGGYMFLTHGPMRLIVALILYLLFVYKIGPKLMAYREAYDLKHLVRIYNLANILMNVYLAVWGFHLSNYGSNFFTCRCLEQNPLPIARYVDHFMISRVADFLDTLFFVLRKKDNQITGLHVFHHAMVPLTIFTEAYFSMTPFSGFFLIINSMVHIIMYIYYFLATFPSLTKHLWWKKHLTKIQISQFVMAGVYNSIGYVLIKRFCKPKFNPIVPVIINVLCAFIFFVLFCVFYISNYRATNERNKQAAKKSS